MDVIAACMDGSNSSAISALDFCELGNEQWEESDKPGELERSIAYTHGQVLVKR